MWLISFWIYTAITTWSCDREAARSALGLTLDLRQAPLLLLRVLSDPPQVVQLCLQELALPRSLQPQVALLGKLRLQLADTPPQRLTQATALARDGETKRKNREAGMELVDSWLTFIDFFVCETSVSSLCRVRKKWIIMRNNGSSLPPVWKTPAPLWGPGSPSLAVQSDGLWWRQTKYHICELNPSLWAIITQTNKCNVTCLGLTCRPSACRSDCWSWRGQWQPRCQTGRQTWSPEQPESLEQDSFKETERKVTRELSV